jgi:tetratricopeptide (TPR) repeat protein/predicted Ser/Thr protein kinase
MSCPGDVLLARLLSSDASSQPDVGLHVADCEDCRRRLAELETEDQTLTSEQVDPLRLGHVGAGASFDRYTILERVGAGGMGEVYAAYDPRLDRRVALKVLRGGGTVDEGARQRLFREAQALARLNHPSVVAVHDVGLAGDEVYVAMEFVDGQTLTGWVREKPRTCAEVLEVFRAAGEGLAAAHDAGLVHRDFKPANVLIGHDGRVRVADFGLARAAGEQEPGPARAADRSVSAFSSYTPLPTLTRNDVVMGTPGYMPPEQLEGLALDPRADQFSFCAALYEALNGERPFRGKSLQALEESMHRGLPQTPPEDVRVAPWLYAVLRRGLSVRAADRYGDMRELLAALLRDPRAARRRRVRGLAAVTAGVLCLATAGLVLRRPPPDVCAEARASPGLIGSAQGGELAQAFSATRVPYATHVAASATRALGEWSDEWTRVRTESCEAARVRAEIPEATWAMRGACLALAAEQARSLVALLNTADPAMVQNALGAIGRLPRPTACLDPRALAALEQLPSDPGVRAQVEALRTRLAGLAPLHEAGRFADAEAALTALLPEVEAVEHAPLTSELLYLRGRARSQQSRYVEAEADLHRAAQLGLAGGQEVAAARAFMQLAELSARVFFRHDQAQMWLAYADGTLRRGGAPAREAVELEHLAGLLRNLESSYQAAHVHFEAALGLQEKVLPQDEPLRIRILDDLGWNLSWLGRHEEGFVAAGKKGTVPLQQLEAWVASRR